MRPMLATFEIWKGIQSRVKDWPWVFTELPQLHAGATTIVHRALLSSVFRTCSSCSTGRAAAIAFMGARWGASHEAASRQTPGSCSKASKVGTFFSTGLVKGALQSPLLFLGGHLCLFLSPWNLIFPRGAAQKLCSLGALSLVSRKIIAQALAGKGALQWHK